LGRHSLLLVRVKATPCLADEVRQVTSLVPGSAVCSLTSVGSRLEDLASSAEVLYVAGRHARELGAALERCCLVGIGLAVLNICRSEVVGRRLLTKGVQHVVCWPSEVHDSEAAAFGTRLVSLLLDKTISEAFDNAVADVGHSERAPKLLIQSLPLQEIRRSTSLWVVLEHRGKARNRSNKPILGRAKVLPHTAVNGWVRVEVGGRAMAWRVGHWRSHRPGRGRPWSSPRRPSSRRQALSSRVGNGSGPHGRCSFQGVDGIFCKAILEAEPGLGLP